MVSFAQRNRLPGNLRRTWKTVPDSTAPLSLALAHVSVENDNVFLTQWTETDFRTGDKPWWG